jgi:excisionase family DNA binding protein
MSKAEILSELAKLPPEELAEVQAKLDELAGEEISIQEAAKMLGVSRGFVIEQIKAGKLRCRGVGRRVRVQDVMNFKRQIDADRREVLDQLAAQAQELKMGY